MTSDRWPRVEALYHEMLARPVHERPAALNAACAGDTALEAEVQSLLAQPTSAARLLATPALEVAARLVSPASALLTGRRIGVFEVQGLLGVGGMGEVYRARDTRLERDVAIKILPRAFQDDPSRLARFEREARVLASLNHPHIGAIHGLEEGDGITALVMELVDGDDLSQRLARGRLPVVEALTIARQIAEALEAAHEQGVIHRDLKPANIKVRRDGTVKVLDFGLAKALAPAAGAGVVPTTMATEAGLVMGTPAYMSPEQARGETAGPQADIWAFGVVLYELLTGISPFVRQTTADTLASVLGAPPDYALLPPNTPSPTRHLIRRCLERDRKRRWQHMGDARIELEEALSTSEVGRSTGRSDSVAAAATAGGRARLRLLWIAATAIMVVAVVAFTLYGRGGQEAIPTNGRSPDVTRSRIDPPGSLWSSRSPDFALSPDGRRLAIVAAEPNGRRMLWIRPLDNLAAFALLGTEDAEAPFWSFDGKSIAFVVNGRLRRISAAGGPVTPVADKAYATPGAWSRDNVILFTPALDSPLWQVPAAGGTPSPVTELNASAGESTHVYPFFLPDGRHFLYAAWATAGASLGVYAGSLASTTGTLLLKGVPNAQYAHGALIYTREAALVARGFDASRRTFTGDDAIPIADQVFLGRLSQTIRSSSRAGAFFVSDAGTLVYHAATPPVSRLVWLDRQGGETGSVGQTAAFGDLFLSRDGLRVLVSIAAGPNRDIWMFDTKRWTGDRVTFNPGDEFVGVFSPDGRRMGYDSRRRGVSDLYEKPASGAGDEIVLYENREDKVLLDWSEKFLIYITMSGPDSAADIWTMAVSGDRTPRRYLATPFREGYGAKASPNGRWIAYPSDKSTRMEVYVAPYPADPGREQQVSLSGGVAPKWGLKGQELYYFEPASGQLMVVELTYRDNSVLVGDARPLFKVRPPEAWALWYDVTEDGQRFLVNTPLDQEARSHLILIQNWHTLLPAQVRKE